MSSVLGFVVVTMLYTASLYCCGVISSLFWIFLGVSPRTSSFQTDSVVRRVCWVMAFSWDTMSVVVSIILS